MPTLAIVCASLVLALAPARQDRPTVDNESRLRARLVTMVFPDYPEDVRLQGAHGTVVVEVVVSGDGDVTNAKAVSGDERLRPLARAAVARWKLKPEPGPSGSISDSVILYFSEEGRVAVSRRPNGVYMGWPGTELTLEDGTIVGTIAGAGDEHEPPIKALDKPTPPFPRMARQAHVYGTVVVEVAVGVDGCVGEARVLSGHPLLRAAAKDAATKWQFEVFKLDGVPTEVSGTLSFHFLPAPPRPPDPSPSADAE